MWNFRFVQMREGRRGMMTARGVGRGGLVGQHRTTYAILPPQKSITPTPLSQSFHFRKSGSTAVVSEAAQLVTAQSLLKN